MIRTGALGASTLITCGLRVSGATANAEFSIFDLVLVPLTRWGRRLPVFPLNQHLHAPVSRSPPPKHTAHNVEGLPVRVVT